MCFQQLPNDQGFVAYLTFVKTEEDERERLSAKAVVPETRGKVAQEDRRSETPMCILDAAMSSGESSETDDSLRESTDEYVSYNHGDEAARLQRSAAGMV